MRVSAFEITEPVPELQNTRAIAMLRPWVDVGSVGTLALTGLERYMDAHQLAELARPGTFFDFTRYRPHTRRVGGRSRMTKPNSVVHYGRAPETGRDHLLLHMLEPHSMAEEYIESIVDLLKQFNVTEYCRVGGMYDTVPHTRPLLVTATLNESQTQKAEGLVSSRGGTYEGPTTIIGYVNEALEDAGIEVASLMVRLPQYAQLDQDHMGAFRLLEVLSAIYDFPASLADPTRGKQQYRYISRLVEANPEAVGIIERMEAAYDPVQAGQEPQDSVTLPPEMEKFLREMSERLDKSEE